MTQLQLPVRDADLSPAATAAEDAMDHATAREAFRLLRSLRKSRAQDRRVLVTAATRRARRLRDSVWRQRLYWQIGELEAKDESRVFAAAQAYTKALEGLSDPSPSLRIACLRQRSICFARLWWTAAAREDLRRLEDLLETHLPPTRAANLLFQLAERAWEEFGGWNSVELAIDAYAAAARFHTKTGDYFEVAECEYQRGVGLWHLWRLDEAEEALRVAHRLWRRWGHEEGVTRADKELTWVFDCRKDYRRMLAAATRTYLGEAKSRYGTLGRVHALEHRATALHALGERGERDRALLHAAWCLCGDERTPGTKPLYEEQLLELGLKLLEWHLEELDFASAALDVRMILSALPGVEEDARKHALRLSIALGRLGDVVLRGRMAAVEHLAHGSADHPLPAGARLTRPNSVALWFFLGAVSAGN